MSAIAPCPFCGGDMHVIKDERYHRPQCKKCGADLGGFATADDAIVAWNTRAPASNDLSIVDMLVTRLPDDLAEIIERELMAWRGVNGGIYTIHAAALGVSIALRSTIHCGPKESAKLAKERDAAIRERDALAKALKKARTYVELCWHEEGGEEAAEAKHDLCVIDAALATSAQEPGL